MRARLEMNYDKSTLKARGASVMYTNKQSGAFTERTGARAMMEDKQLRSNRSFGTLFAFVFFVLGSVSWWKGRWTFPYLFGVAGLFGVITLLRANWLAPLNRAWMRLAEVLNRIMSPIVLGVMYYVILTPFGLAMRLVGRDPMRRRPEPNATTYWIARQPPGPPPESLRDQF
jgi:hypothetical protein